MPNNFNYEKAFSINVRKFRKKLGMTQKELADAMGYSEKTVSKWETEGSVPSIEALFRVANIFHVSIVELFRCDENIYYLGIDGGGTKTEFALQDIEDKIVCRLFMDGCNPNSVGIEQTKRIIKDGILQVCKDVPLSSVVVYAGIAGCASGNYADEIKSMLEKMSFASCDVGSDNNNIVSAGLGDTEGITMILGTGICSYVVKKEETKRIAGWGYLFDNGGSSFHIGRDAINAYFSAYDGSGEETTLVQRIKQTFNYSNADFIKYLYNGGNKVVSSYAMCVFEEAEKGDQVSVAILKKNIAEIARLIRVSLSHFSTYNEKIPVILGGGLTNQELLLPYLFEALGDDAKKCNIQILSVPPVQGALELAKALWKERNRNE
ncbi:MAG: XRE family transcriptional regulator [Clostridia bacterium]|nr:XRE family transcriptional regulator [Clostridia bacterium]